MFRNFHSFSDRIAIYSDDSSHVTYGELEIMVRDFEALLETSELVFILGANDLESLVCYLAAIRKGCVALLLSPDIEEDYLLNLTSTYKPKYIWAPFSTTPNLSLSHSQQQTFNSYNLLSSTYNLNLPSSLALLLTTSGSTGNPKLIRISKKNLETNTSSIVEALNLERSDRAITTLPMNYSYGLSIINTHLQIGATLIMNSYPISSREFWDYAKKTKATSMGGVPFTYEILSKFNSKFISESSLKKFTQAGGKLSREKVLEIFELVDGIGGTFIVMYGQTEATARISTLPHKLIKGHPDSIGRPIPKGKIVLVDEFGGEISAPFQNGELRYVGPNVCLGYAERLEDLYSPDNNNGSLDTGDIAYVDADGLFFISGRKNRFVKLFGVRTNLDDIEHALSQAGFTCICHQKNDKLLIFTTDVEMLQSINDYVKSLYKLPLNAFSTIAIKSIPRSDSGKVLYANLLEEVEA